MTNAEFMEILKKSIKSNPDATVKLLSKTMEDISEVLKGEDDND